MQHTDRQLRPVRWFQQAARNGLARLGALLAVGWLAFAAMRNGSLILPGSRTREPEPSRLSP